MLTRADFLSHSRNYLPVLLVSIISLSSPQLADYVMENEQTKG